MDLSEVSDQDLPLVGGKAGKLGELIRQGLPIPPGFVLTTEAYLAFVEGTELRTLIPEFVQSINLDQPESTEAASRKIREAFDAAEFPPGLKEAVLTAYHAFVSRHRVDFCAVRSS